jgi:hypothetical protein
MKRFWRAKTAERRPILNCCSVSISISCCSLPAAVGLALAGLLVWLGLRYRGEELRKRSVATEAS